MPSPATRAAGRAAVAPTRRPAPARPGAWAPAHEHPADEECLVLEDSLWQGDVFLEAGDFHVARPGMTHGELRTDTGALVFIRYAKPLSQYIRM